MPFFESKEQMIQVFDEFWKRTLEEQEVMEKLKKSGLVIRFDIDQPSIQITINLRDDAPDGSYGTISYDSDVHQATGLMVAAARDTERVLVDPQPVCQLNDFGDNAVQLEVLFWIHDPENGISNVRSAVRMKIWEAFKANDITIPFPQRFVNMAVQKAD